MNNQKLHEEVKKLARIYLDSEKNLIGPLIQVKQLKAYRDFECHGLDEYCEKQLGFSESVARMFQTVVNHAIKKPALRKALETDRLSVTYASKIVSQLTDENIEEVLAFTENHSISETERWLDEKNGGEQFRDFPLKFRTIDLLKKIMDVTPGHAKGKGDAIVYEALLALYVKVHPVEKARRAAEKKAKRQNPAHANAEASPKGSNAEASSKGVNTDRSASQAQEESKIARAFKRIPLTAEQKHAVHGRDSYRCTQLNRKGERCKETQHLHVHHIHFVSEGGSNDLENLTTLCAEHHDLAHQMSFPLNDPQTSEWTDRYGWTPTSAPLQ